MESRTVPKKMERDSLECIGKLNLHKAQFCAFNTSESTTIPLTVQNCHQSQIPRTSTEFSCPGFHDKLQNSLPMHCNAL